MSYRDEIINFSVEGYKKTGNIFVTDGKHRHVLGNRLNNFFGPPPKIKFHPWAGSLKSSQALAYNIFSGNKDAMFEYDMWALDNNPLHKASIDVAINCQDDLVKMFEVKMFEITENIGKNKIFHTTEQKKYFDGKNYVWNKDIAKTYIPFINKVVKYFRNQSIYGEGIKQLCCHLLGIINEMTIDNGKLTGKNIELYSLCLDNPFLPKFQNDIKNYKNTLWEFKSLVDEFLKEINFNKRIKYLGFWPLSDFLKENIVFLGNKNVEYVKIRYYQNQRFW